MADDTASRFGFLVAIVEAYPLAYLRIMEEIIRKEIACRLSGFETKIAPSPATLKRVK